MIEVKIVHWSSNDRPCYEAIVAGGPSRRFHYAETPLDKLVAQKQATAFAEGAVETLNTFRMFWGGAPIEITHIEEGR